MASVCIALLFAIVLVLFEHATSGRPHISNLNVLLPPRTTHAVRYRLQGYGGCFVWTWDHHDILSLQAEYNGTEASCSTSAIIMPIAPFDERQATAVHATDTLTGEVLRCEVFVDKLSRIQIFHHSVKLDLDGWATLRIRAFDAEDNVFSSLVGLRFLWQLSGNFPHRLLHVPLKDSPLSDCGSMCGEIDTQIELEESGFGSDLYVVRGVAAGQETVRARLVELNMDELEDALLLTVAEAISLEPHSPVYVIPRTQFQFKLKTVRQNVLREVNLPSPHHQWSSTNSSVVAVDPQKGVVTAAKHTGVTNIIVEDLRVKGHQQLATVHVLIPTSLKLFLLPFSQEAIASRMPWHSDAKLISATWYLVKGREYVVHTLAFSLQSGVRPLYLTQSNKLRLLFTYLPYWEAIEVPGNLALEHGWQNASIIAALASGSGALVAKLSYEEEEGPKELKVQQSVEVCDIVSIAEGSSTLHLPWSPGLSQEYVLRAEGGCGEKAADYVWSSSDAAVATVDAYGLVYTKGPGKAIIQVASVFDYLNAAKIQVEVSIPATVTPLHGLAVEVEVNTHIPVAISMATASEHPYSRCDGYNAVVQWDVFGADGFKLMDPSEGVNYLDGKQVICAWAVILPTKPGRATVSAAVKVSSEAPSSLQASWMVASYLPLALAQVSDGSCCGGYSCGGTEQDACLNLEELLLVVGSSTKVAVKGGPERWREGSTFVEYNEVIPSETDGQASDEVLIVRSAESGGRTFLITCTEYGNYTSLFYRGYQGSQDSLNTVASASLRVICSVPSSAVLIIDEPVNSLRHVKLLSQLERDKDRKRLAPLTVVNSRTIRVAAVGLHNSGRPFANASSLALAWDLDGCSGKAYWEDVLYESWSWERKLVLENNAGLCTVRAAISHLRHGSLPAPASHALKQAKAHLSDAAQLQLVAALRMNPTEILLLAHPDAKATLEVIGGTNEIESHVNDSRVASVIQPPLGTRISHLTVLARGKGSALISIKDVGLASPASASALVHVADIAWVRLAPEDASIQFGETVEIHLQAGDSSGRAFPQSQLELLNVRAHFQDDIAELVDQETAGSSLKIRATSLGLTTFHVSVQQSSGRELHSDHVKIEVYPPLDIQPSPLVLAPGAEYLVSVRGGPRTGVIVEFSSSNSIVAAVDSTTGLVIARSVGNELIVAKAHRHDGVLLGEASTGITVAIPIAMNLEVGSGQLAVGREMSIHPSSNEGNLFAFFEMCTSYEWLTTDDEVLRLESVEPTAAKGTEQSSDTSDSIWLVDAGFSARVTARFPGRATVKVRFVCNFHVLGGLSEPKIYTASDVITVIADPPLALGMCATWILPPAYKSSTLLSQKSFNGIGRAIAYSLMQNDVGISIDDGRIKTSERTESTCIQAKDRSTGRAEVAACIRVAEISQMTVGDNGFPFHVAELSVGTQQDFMVTLRDKIGAPFFEVNLETFPLSIETNRPDVVSTKAVLSSTGTGTSAAISVHALRQGKALIRISQKNRPGVADYILVLVGAYVYPRGPTMHIGNRANFSILGKGLHSSSTAHAERGHWSSGNENIVRINSRTGEADAVGEGVTTVSFNGSRLTAYTSVTVVGISSVLVEAPKLRYLTNVPFPDQGYKFPVKFRDSRGGDTGVVGEGRTVSFDCKVNPSFIGRAAPRHDPSTGSFSCTFFPYTPENIAFSLHGELKSKRVVKGVGDSKGLLSMSVVAVVTSSPDVSGAAEATFAGGFSIIETPPQLQLSARSNKSRIVVVGSIGSIVVSWQRRDALDIKLLSKVHDLGVGGYAVYEANLLDEETPFTDKLVFVLPTTGQREEIRVWYEAAHFQAATLTQQVLTVSIITLLCIALPLFLCSKLFDWKRRPAGVPNQATPRASSPMVGQLLRDGCAEGVFVDDGSNLDGELLRTPMQFRTFSRSPPPQPYTEYVSRTIEQTPYFSRTQRHTDPSRTY